MKVKLNTPKGRKWFEVIRVNEIQTWGGKDIQIHFKLESGVRDYVYLNFDLEWETNSPYYKFDEELATEIAILRMK